MNSVLPPPPTLPVWNANVTPFKFLADDEIEGMEEKATPGTVVKVNWQIGVATADGMLRLETIQLEGKKRTTPASFANGRPEFVGSVLG